ncbi:MAG: PilZ domain-containing protein [candidate division WOR-3 bacterium]
MERRRAIRVPINIILDVYKNGKLEHSYRGCGINLSLKGIAIETDGEFEKNEDVLLKINIPIDVKGKIVWSKQEGKIYRYGIKFEKLGFFEKFQVKKYIKARLLGKASL